MILSFIIGIALIMLEKRFGINTLVTTPSTIYLILAGFMMSIGIVVPGISNTVLLMCLGIYPTYISAVASINLYILAPMGIGLILGSLLWLKLINYLLTKYHSATFFSIIGFTLGSVFVLYPGLSFDLPGIMCALLFIICLIVSYKLSV